MLEHILATLQEFTSGIYLCVLYNLVNGVLEWTTRIEWPSQKKVEPNLFPVC